MDEFEKDIFHAWAERRIQALARTSPPDERERMDSLRRAQVEVEFMRPTTDSILSALECSRGGCPCHGARSRGRGLTHCPVAGHGQGRGDRGPSLSVRRGDDGAIWHCHAGCRQESVTQALSERGILRQSINWRRQNTIPLKDLQ